MAQTANQEGSDTKAAAKPAKIDFRDPDYVPEDEQRERWEVLLEHLDGVSDAIKGHGKKAARDIVSDPRTFNRMNKAIRRTLNDLNRFFGRWARGEPSREDEEY